MKKLISLLLALCMIFALCACGAEEAADVEETEEVAETEEAAEETEEDGILIGLVCVHDETIGYDQAHIDGFKTAIEACGLTEDNYIIKTNIPETEEAYDACVDLA